MAGINVPQYEIFKIGTDKLKYSKWNLNIDKKEAFKYQESVSLFEGQQFRIMAKKIINGRMYNTDTTEVLGSWDNGYPRGDFSFEEQTLHKKKTGEYFVYASGGAQSNFGDCYGGHDCSGEKFIPMSVEQAQQWSEEYLTVEKYVEIWGEPEE